MINYMLELLRFKRYDFGVDEFFLYRTTAYYVFYQMCVINDETLIVLTVWVVVVD